MVDITAKTGSQSIVSSLLGTTLGIFISTMCSMISSSNNITLDSSFDISYHGNGDGSNGDGDSSSGSVISCGNDNQNTVAGIDNNNNNNKNNTMVLLLPLIISYCSCSWISIALSYYSLTQVTITSLSNHRLDFLIFNYMKQFDVINNTSSTIMINNKDDSRGDNNIYSVDTCNKRNSNIKVGNIKYHHRDINNADSNNNHNYDDDGDNDDDRDMEKYKSFSILTPEKMRKKEYMLGIYEPILAKMPSLSIGNDVNIVFESLNEYQVR